MVGPDDPLAPGQVLDRIAEMRELPVHQRGHGEGGWVEQGVIRPEVSMRQHPPGRTGQLEACDGNGVQRAKQLAAGAQDWPRVPALDQVLAMLAGEERHGELARQGGVDLRHRQAAAQPFQHLAFPRQAGQGVRALIGLDDNARVAARVIGVAVSQRVLKMIIS